MKRLLFFLFVLTAALLAACDTLPSLGSSPTLDPNLPTPAPTSNLLEPDGVATTFLDAWEKGNYEGMYSHLTSTAQNTYSLEAFTSAHTNAARTMTATDLSITPLTGYHDPGSNGAQFSYRVVYHTTVLGDVEKEITMNLVFENDRWAVVWGPNLILPELVNNNYLALDVDAPSRANIYDQDGDWLVRADSSVVRLYYTVGSTSDEFEDDMLGLLSEMLRLSPDVIRQQYAGVPEGQVRPLGDMDLEVFNQYRTQFFSWDGLTAEETIGRRYYGNGVAAHVIGYTGTVTAEACPEYESRGYSCDDIVGQMGLEQWGESYLAGQRGGILSAYTPSGNYYDEVARRDPAPAESLYVSIDRDLQAITADAIANAYGAGRPTWTPTAGGAAVVIVEVDTGFVRAMASYPTFDPNVFHPRNSHPFATGNYLRDLVNNPLDPLFNRATQGAQPPGSIFKLVTATAAMEHPSFGPGWSYNSTGEWCVNIGGSLDCRTDWLEGGHGSVDLAGALTVSCNSCFYEVGYVTGQDDFDIIPNYAEAYHLGQEFDLPIAEVAGNIPDPQQATSDGRPWSVLDSVNIAIGQGDVLVTPLQIAMMTAAVANGGTVYEPQLVERIGLIGEEPSVVYEPEVLNTLDVPPEHLELMRQAMREVAVAPYGTAEYRLGNLQIPVAGKTGTAQVSSNAPPIAWFTGFVPYDDPELAIVVMVENGGQGSSVAAPIFRRIVEEWYGLRVLDYPRDWGDPELFDFVAPGE
ncbi:MAG: hypothetical protein GYB64_01015 [Chloroflexi bacterium]|nr:hypothetical protein [Chloroflexota bacterium]